MHHDSSYKQIFSHPETVTELLRGFVDEEWVRQVDFSTLEKVSGSYVSDDLREREDDIIWRVKVKDRWIYIYLLIEFQSRNDPWVALRIMVYTGLLYQDLIKSEAITTQDRLPPVFPIVLYNGEPRWTAKRELSELIEPYPASLAAYRPSQRYFLLDEGRIGEVDLKQAEGIVAEIIRLESSQEPDVWREIIGRLTARLKEKRYDSLRRALVIWITRNVLKRVVPEDNILEITELQEIDNMLAERADKWVEKWKQQGLEQGLQQGEGKIVIRQIQKRFGQPPKWVEEKIANATEEQLEHWADSILEATSLEEVFGE